MRIIYRMIFKSFIVSFAVSILFFIMIIELLDLFSNLWRYINNSVSFASMMHVSFLYIPKCIFYAIPISILFSVSFTLGSMYSKNELIAIFGAGISIYRVAMLLIICGFIVSVFSFFFNEYIVTVSYAQKNDLTARLLNTEKKFNNDDITIMNSTRKVIYSADYYNDDVETIITLMLIDRTDNTEKPMRIDAKRAIWDNQNNYWTLFDCRKYVFSEAEDKYLLENVPRIENERYDLKPSAFRKVVNNVEDMSAREAYAWIESLRISGLPYRSHLTEYYKRFSFPFTALIVTIIASSFGGSFKKNILLMSLLSSLLLAAGYYILQMVLSLFARLGLLPPAAGAWGSFVVFFILSIVLLRNAKT